MRADQAEKENDTFIFYDDGPIVTVPEASKRQMREPRLQLGCVYSGQDVVWNLEISPTTLARWVGEGLKPYRSKQSFFLADDVLQYWRNRPEND